MTNLLYKELSLSINKFFYLLPIILAGLMFIPYWIYTILFMYFFWITVPQIYGSYIGQRDQSFINVLPVTKKEVVQSKMGAILILEGLHLASGFLFGIIHNNIYGTYNIFFDVNFAFLGAMILMYTLFNLIFFPMYFKTGYFFGKATIYGVVVTLIYGFILEFSVTKYTGVQEILEGTLGTQVLVMLVGLALSVILSIFTYKKSLQHYQEIN